MVKKKPAIEIVKVPANYIDPMWDGSIYDPKSGFHLRPVPPHGFPKPCSSNGRTTVS